MPLRLNAAQAPSDYYPETHAAPQECQRRSRKKKFKYTSWNWWLNHQTDMLLEGAGTLPSSANFTKCKSKHWFWVPTHPTIDHLQPEDHAASQHEPESKGGEKNLNSKSFLSSSEVIWPHATNRAKSIGWDKKTSSRACCTQQPTPEAWFHLLGGRSLQCCWTCSLAQDIFEVLQAVNIIGLVEAHW
jgi:hypothetical protein